MKIDFVDIIMSESFVKDGYLYYKKSDSFYKRAAGNIVEPDEFVARLNKEIEQIREQEVELSYKLLQDTSVSTTLDELAAKRAERESKLAKFEKLFVSEEEDRLHQMREDLVSLIRDMKDVQDNDIRLEQMNVARQKAAEYLTEKEKVLKYQVKLQFILNGIQDIESGEGEQISKEEWERSSQRAAPRAAKPTSKPIMPAPRPAPRPRPRPAQPAQSVQSVQSANKPTMTTTTTSKPTTAASKPTQPTIRPKITLLTQPKITCKPINLGKVTFSKEFSKEFPFTISISERKAIASLIKQHPEINDIRKRFDYFLIVNRIYEPLGGWNFKDAHTFIELNSESVRDQVPHDVQIKLMEYALQLSEQAAENRALYAKMISSLH